MLLEQPGHILMFQNEAPVFYSYLEMVLEMGEEFESDFRGTGRHLNSYT